MNKTKSMSKISNKHAARLIFRQDLKLKDRARYDVAMLKKIPPCCETISCYDEPLKPK